MDGFFPDLKDAVSNSMLIFKNACSVRVAVRVRPLINREIALGSSENNMCIDVTSKKNLTITGRNFEFDSVFELAA